MLVKDYNYVQRSVSYYRIMDSVRRDRFINPHSCGTLSLSGAATSIICRDKYVFVATKVCLSRQTFCREKIMFVATKRLPWQIFVATNTILSRQKFCCDDKHTLAATNTCLSRQGFCRYKQTKIILAAGPANDTTWAPSSDFVFCGCTLSFCSPSHAGFMMEVSTNQSFLRSFLFLFCDDQLSRISSTLQARDRPKVRWNDCGRAFPGELRASSFHRCVATFCLDRIVSPFRFHWVPWPAASEEAKRNGVRCLPLD